MLEKALVGTKRYYGLLAILAGLFALGFLFYLKQLNVGLSITGMGRDVSWGFYISQFTYLVGVAASAVMVVLPYYLHNYKAFGRVTILGEFLAVAAVSMCVTFVLVDMGRPDRVFNVFKYPTPGSVMFWDIIVLNGYLVLNILIGWNVLECERHSIAPPKWVKFLSYVSIPWAVSIHTVTAFLYAGLPGRGYWLTAILAPRFLSSAFAAGPALLILLCLLVRKYSKFDPGKEQIQTLAKIVTYATLINVFFFFCEVFTVFYSQLPDHMAHFQYLFFGLDGKGQLVPLMWFSIVGMTLAGLFLVNPKLRKNECTLAALCGLVIITTWLDKGLGLMTGGFVPNPLEQVVEYWPTAPEAIISLGVWAMGFLVLTLLYKIAVSIKEEIKS
ncbi:MAG: NrfD/PsrC family molybdoenzyme membrane anchor subunit [Deltaproteobacteria bacterium]|nr:NrfD/PsrC family molybdoenzyme membrane anchor subunit [Deltaproteobacteria bacterium]